MNQDMVIITKTCCCLQITITVDTCIDLFMLNRNNGEFFIFKEFVVLRYVYMYISELLISSEGGGMRDSNFKVMIFVSWEIMLNRLYYSLELIQNIYSLIL